MPFWNALCWKILCCLSERRKWATSHWLTRRNYCDMMTPLGDGEQVALAVPFRSPFLAESRVRRTMRMARKLETPAMLSKSVCPTARAISIPTSHREAHGIKWSWNRNLDALVTECNYPVLLEIIKQVLWCTMMICAWIYMYIYTLWLTTSWNSVQKIVWHNGM